MAYRSFLGNDRGGFAPRRGRVATRSFVKRTVVKPDIIKHPLGQLLATLRIADLELPAYALPQTTRFPQFPTEPAVRALFNINPHFPTNEVDIFACGNTMGNLLRFVSSIDKSFRFNIELIGSTVFLVRKENDPRETIDGIHGYGHTFPEAYTTWDRDVKGSESHQRLCRYKFGRLKCIVRFECDGYLKKGLEHVGGLSTLTQGFTVDNILSSLKNVAVTRSLTDQIDTLTIKPGGGFVPQHAIFDLKTRSGRYKKEINMDEIYPLLWLKQIPNFVVAYHDGAGTFPNAGIYVKNVKDDINVWEKRNKPAIRRLAVLLEKIIEIAKHDGTGLLEVYCPSADRLEIRRQDGQGVHALPSDLRNKWDGPLEELTFPDQKDDDGGGRQFDNDSDSELDYTACGADCGYCGRCTY
ncbi:hypothetical protein N0V90_009332 [Kalmusia sp. IMI 367209]|nr:hypothetical protein N0V90_009332 [Kalmusia sp. IMI 367209]